jgi:phosphoglycerate dehydrogenase-like enzyme
MAESDRPLVYIHRVEWCPYEYYMNEANMALLESFAEVRNNGDGREELGHDQVVEHLQGVDAILSLNGAHIEEITHDALQEAGSVQVVSVAHWWNNHGESAREWQAAGVEVIDASDPCNQAVAEWALGAIICGLRKVDAFDRRMKGGEEWPGWQGFAGQLNGSTVGLVAVGRVGRWLLRYLQPFDCRVLVYDPYLDPAEAEELGVELVDLDTLMQSCDAISLHAPVTPETENMIGEHELSLIRDDALLVNSARAWLLDNDAFRREMQTGRFRAYLDVYDPEPPPADDVLRELDNVVMTPHVAGTTDAMFLRCGRSGIRALRDYFQGE